MRSTKKGRFSYYEEKLSAERLKKAYAIAPPRVKQYLEAEVSYVLSHISAGDTVLDLGCGYGRAMPGLAGSAGRVTGIDNSWPSLLMARQKLARQPRTSLVAMDAVHLGFRAGVFDVVACIQNGISAFHVDRHALITESLRVTREGGKVLFSTYSEKFWEHRLDWFERQSAAGLLGKIDYEQTRDGLIVCKDGFRATAVSAAELRELAAGLRAAFSIEEVDGSSLFLVLKVKEGEISRPEGV
ncbi:MAG: class I SAM-dependent methyltransferase [Candidatus Aminicenantes bacterium]|nr:class I SAM-dependent methyltransferase [Candidatus Aminicenantes bacterium]